MPNWATELGGTLVIKDGERIEIESNVGGIVWLARSEGTSAFQFNYTQWASTGAGTAPTLSLRRARGTAAAPVALASSDYLGAINFRGWDGSSFIDAADIRIITAAAWAAASPGPEVHSARLAIFLTNTTGAKAEVLRIGHDLVRLGSGTTEMGVNFVTTGGVKWGTATTQKQSWWNATPVVQPANIVDATAGDVIDVQARAAINALLAQHRTLGLMAAS